MKYERQSSERKPRQVRGRILIVCEGEKTEPNYFNSFKKHHENVVLEIRTRGIGKDAMKVVKEAINEKCRNPNKFDRVWAVFDKDEIPDDEFNNAISTGKNESIEVAWSNEAFELWFLYHFIDVNTSMSRYDYANEISKHINASPNYKSKVEYQYKKNDSNNYETMTTYGSTYDAINRAEKKYEQYSDKDYASHNPCTTVYRLVRQLIGQDQKFNKELKKKS